MKRLALVVLANLLVGPVVAEEIAVMPRDVGHVTLSWEKFNDLWNQLKSMEKQIDTLANPQNHPPVPFTLTKAVYQGDVQAHRVLVNAIFELDVYEKKNWVKIPFLPSTVAIEEARLDGAPVGIVEEGDFHQVLLREAGRHILRVRYALKSPKEEDVPQLVLATPNTPMTLLAMRFPKPHLNVTVEPSQGLEIETQNGGTLVTASIPPTSLIHLRWQKDLPEEAAGPAKLYADIDTLYTVSEAAVRGQWSLNYTILHRGVREILVAVPESWNVLAVNCEGLQEWKMRDTKEGPVLAIQLAYARKGNVAIAVTTERSISDKDQVLDLPRLRPINVEREQGNIALEARGTVELQIQESAGLNPIDPQELSRAVWNMAAQPVLFAFRYTKPHNLVVNLKRHPEVPVLTTTIDSANAVTLITQRGQMISRIRYEVRNNLKQFLAVQLPRGSKLWSAFVSGQPVKPTQLENGAYRIPLAKSQLEMQGQEGFPVELVYYTPIHKFFPIGYQASSFPVPDAPVSNLLWSVYFPKDYRVAHFGGDMEEAGFDQSLSSIGGLAGVETRAEDEKGSIDQPSRRDSLKQKVAAKFGMMQRALHENSSLATPAAGPVSQQAELVADMMMPTHAATMTGVYPVAFEIPASGQLFHFGQVMVVDKNPTLRIFYLHAWIVKILFFMALAGLALGVYRKRGILVAAGEFFKDKGLKALTLLQSAKNPAAGV